MPCLTSRPLRNVEQMYRRCSPHLLAIVDNGLRCSWSARWESNPRIRALQAPPLAILVLAHGQSDGTRTRITAVALLYPKQAGVQLPHTLEINPGGVAEYTPTSPQGDREGFEPSSPGLLCFRTGRGDRNRTCVLCSQSIGYTISLHPVVFNSNGGGLAIDPKSTVCARTVSRRARREQGFLESNQVFRLVETQGVEP